jgi:multidrug efflux pump subunit AcrA (membrane-fusion protein)
MQKAIKFLTRLWTGPRWRLLAVAALLLGLGWYLFRGDGRGSGNMPTFAARRGPLEINILEGGSLQALESQEIKCDVHVGYQGTKILRIVEEGYLVTDEDVKTNKVLVELDSSDLEKQIVQQEIQYESAAATLIDAQQNYEIQLNQNQSDIKTAEQKTRFARMDFDKFLGDAVTTRIIQEVGLDALLAAAGTNDVEQTLRAEGVEDKTSAPQPPPQKHAPGGPPRLPPGFNPPPPPPASSAPEPPPAPAPEPVLSLPPAFTNVVLVDFSQYARLDALGDGEARQKLRKFDDDLQVSQKELGQANSTLEGTQRLFEKGFVTKLEMQRDEIAADNSRLKVQTAQSARDLYLKYDFLKSAEESLSKYAESVRELDKARRVAISKAAQARARLKSAQGQHEIQLRQRKELTEQREKCLLHATKTGLVVYGGGRDDNFFGGEERIREGASVRERQAIITIPDMTRMAVNVKVHETYIKKIRKGLKARITIDAFADKTLTGEVTKVAVLPDSQNRWMNPDMKVYLTSVAIDGTQDWVKPGMSAKVEILVSRIDACLQVPVQAVTFDGDKQVCYLLRGLKTERREVDVGEFNDEFIEIKGGLKEGDRVLLRLPDGVQKDRKETGTEPAKAPEPAKPAPPQPPAKK